MRNWKVTSKANVRLRRRFKLLSKRQVRFALKKWNRMWKRFLAYRTKHKWRQTPCSNVFGKYIQQEINLAWTVLILQNSFKTTTWGRFLRLHLVSYFWSISSSSWKKSVLSNSLAGHSGGLGLAVVGVITTFLPSSSLSWSPARFWWMNRCSS